MRGQITLLVLFQAAYLNALPIDDEFLGYLEKDQLVPEGFKRIGNRFIEVI
jgi:hypothetical protein